MTPAQLRDVADALAADPRPLSVEGNGLGNLAVFDAASGEFVAWVDWHDGQVHWVV